MLNGMKEIKTKEHCSLLVLNMKGLNYPNRFVGGGHTDLILNGIFLHSRKRKLTKDMD